MREVEYVIIGAGIAGLALRRFLRSERVVLLDPEPGGYKIGESHIPEFFHHPALRALLPRVRAMPSYSMKWGSTFISGGTVAAFPLPPNLAELAMHMERAELERTMIDAWAIAVTPERVVAVDLDQHTVVTDRNRYRFAHQVIDCSGPAMVVARALGDQRDVLPAFATWSYYDVALTGRDDPARCYGPAGRRLRCFDATEARLLDGPPPPGWTPARTTTLTQVADRQWLWQIPLFDATRLSVGLVSRTGPVSAQALDDAVAAHGLGCYRLTPRPRDESSVYNRLHTRPHFARRASTASSTDHILVADAFAFGDPIYSVGTGLAVNKALQVAEMLNDGGWSAEKSAFYNEQYERLLTAAMAAFEYWYDGALIEREGVAAAVQRDMLRGDAFPGQIAEYYHSSLRGALGDPDTTRHREFPDLDLSRSWDPPGPAHGPRRD